MPSDTDSPVVTVSFLWTATFFYFVCFCNFFCMRKVERAHGGPPRPGDWRGALPEARVHGGNRHLHALGLRAPAGPGRLQRKLLPVSRVRSVFLFAVFFFFCRFFFSWFFCFSYVRFFLVSSGLSPSAWIPLPLQNNWSLNWNLSSDHGVRFWRLVQTHNS